MLSSNPGNVSERSLAKKPPVFTAELRRAGVANLERGTCRIDFFGQEQTSRFVQAKVFLVLDRA